MVGALGKPRGHVLKVASTILEKLMALGYRAFIACSIGMHVEQQSPPKNMETTNRNAKSS